jgi:TRAP-type C4-dicarboxylate transport system substrate-binding protein
MKRITAILIAIVVISSLMLSACSTPAPAPAPGKTPAPAPAPAKVYELTFSCQWPEPSPNWQKQFKLIIDEMQQKSNGTLKITSYPGGTLGKNEEHYDMARTGKADMIHISAGYTPGRFPMTDVFTLPVAYDTTVPYEEMTDVVGQQIVIKEFPDTQVTEFNQSQLFYIYTNKPVNKLEDLKGMKIRSSGAVVTRTVEALGGVPINMGLGDLYMSLQTGVVDGAIMGPSGVFAFKLTEVVKYETKVNLGCTAQFWAVNSNTWKGLPPNLQKIITDTSKKVGPYEVDLFKNDSVALSKLLVSRGGGSIELTADEQARWVKAVSPVAEEYLADLKKKGKPADELIKSVRDECKKRNLSFPY